MFRLSKNKTEGSLLTLSEPTLNRRTDSLQKSHERKERTGSHERYGIRCRFWAAAAIINIDPALAHPALQRFARYPSARASEGMLGTLPRRD